MRASYFIFPSSATQSTHHTGTHTLTKRQSGCSAEELNIQNNFRIHTAPGWSEFAVTVARLQRAKFNDPQWNGAELALTSALTL